MKVFEILEDDANLTMMTRLIKDHGFSVRQGLTYSAPGKMPTAAAKIKKTLLVDLKKSAGLGKIAEIALGKDIWEVQGYPFDEDLKKFYATEIEVLDFLEMNARKSKLLAIIDKKKMQ